MFQSRSGRDAVRKAKAIGKASQLRYDSGHRLRFAGVLQCMEMELELHDVGEVWWEFQRRANPDRWAQRAIPAESRLYVFTDRAPKASKPANKPLQPASRAQHKPQVRKRKLAARG